LKAGTIVAMVNNRGVLVLAVTLKLIISLGFSFTSFAFADEIKSSSTDMKVSQNTPPKIDASHFSIELYQSQTSAEHLIAVFDKWRFQEDTHRGLLFGLRSTQVEWQFGVGETVIVADVDERRGLSFGATEYGDVEVYYLEVPIGLRIFLEDWRWVKLYSRLLAVPMWRVSQSGHLYQRSDSFSISSTNSLNTSPTTSSFMQAFYGGLGLAFQIINPVNLNLEAGLQSVLHAKPDWQDGGTPTGPSFTGLISLSIIP
jgi:hypothetical protein